MGGMCETELEIEKYILRVGSLGMSWKVRRMYCGWEL